MSDKPIFLMVLNDLDWFWSHRLPLARAIQEKGYALHVVCAGAADDPKLKEMGVTGHDLTSAGTLLKTVLTIPVRIFEVGKLIHTLKPALVHGITLRFALYTGLAARAVRHGPVIFTVAGLGSLYSSPSLPLKIVRTLAWPFLKLAFAGKDRFIIFQNPDDQAILIRQNIVREDQTSLIRGSGVDLKEFPFVPEPPALKPKVLFSSRLIKEKGIYEFIAAAKHLLQKNIPAEFIVAGSVYPNNPRSIDQAEIEDWHARGVINWLGQVEDMQALLAETTLVVLPSYYGEGVPKMLLEAAATGRAIITCDMPGCREAVKHEVNGLLIPPQDVHALSDAIEALLDSKSKREEMGRAGRAHIESDFEVGVVVQRTLDVYARALNVKSETS